MTIIDFCEDNLRRIFGAADAAERLQSHIRDRVRGESDEQREAVRFYSQRCLNACSDCHRQSLIVRFDGELISGSCHASVIDEVLGRLLSRDG